MSQTAIPLEFEQYLQNKVSLGEPTDLNEIIFAMIPNLDLSKPIDRTVGLPPLEQWVYQQDVDQVGKSGINSVVYSVVIQGSQESFTFNAMFLRDKNVPDSCGMVVYKATETKEISMALTKSMLMQFDGAASAANVIVDAATWQIDYQARLSGMDEEHRLACLDNYGHTAFVDGFDVTRHDVDQNKYLVAPGVVYVGGLRIQNALVIAHNVSQKPTTLWLDVHRDGTALSTHENQFKVVASNSDLVDYVDGDGLQHYVCKLAGVEADGSVVDWRVKGGLDEHLQDSFAHEKHCGWKGTYEQVVIPLVPNPNAGQKLNRAEVNGKITFRRGHESGSLYNTVVDLVCGSSYSETQAYSSVVTQRYTPISTKLVTFDLDHQSWVGLAVLGGSPEARVSFFGTYENQNSFENPQLRVIPYYNTKTETVVNGEVHNSMLDYTTPDEPLLLGLHKIYHEGNLGQMLTRLERGQGLPWDSNRVYKTGEICTVEIDGEVIHMQMYAGPSLTCQGKSPLDESNRHESWADNTKPFWWIPYTGNQVGMPFFWLDNSAPEWAVMEINVDLPIAVYWRLARCYPHLVNGETINTGEIRGEFLRVLDQGRGVNANRQINTFESHSIEYHNHLLPTGSALAGSGLWGVNDQYWMQVEGENWSPSNDSFAVSGHSGRQMPLSKGGSWSEETRPRNVSRAMAIVI
ncbi:phage tail protein [Vibrio splendidus]|uniref:phage tail-collar fiber domain-containing protein n=1 Tax=Vibrio splendidus TaxID=29497 RepID=UPI001F52DBB2|nr:phage tail protein [Vibrio splendidus]